MLVNTPATLDGARAESNVPRATRWQMLVLPAESVRKASVEGVLVG